LSGLEEVAVNRLSTAKRAQIVSALVEGNSIRATCRMTGAAKGTVLKLLADLGRACRIFQDVALRELPCKRIQADEIWAFCYAKAKNVPAEKRGQLGYGDVWTWTALCADTKLVPSWVVGGRDAGTALGFMCDLADRITGRIQLTTDGHNAYLSAVEGAFGHDIDYAQLVKLYGESPESEKRYSPAKCIGCRSEWRSGAPEPEHVSTSYVERQNLTMRMQMRRFTRLTNAFSKKLDNLEHALALHYMNYNFRRVHRTIGCTPAMAAGKTSAPFTLEQIVELLDLPQHGH
jgi:IS1 family transposase